MVWPIHAATGNLLATYNAAFLASFVLTAWGTFLLARALTGSFAAGLVAAVVAAFNEYRLVYEIAHLHVLSIHWFPFTLYALHRYFQTDARRYLILAAAALVALNLSSIYYMAYCAPFVAVFALGEMVRWRRWRTARVWVELWAAAALVVLVTAPFLLPYAEVQQRLGVVRALPEVIGYSATLDHYRTALPGMATAVVLGLVALVGAIIQRDAPARWVTAMSVLLLALAFWLSLGPVPQAGGRAIGIPGLYAWLYEYVPGYQGLRVPSRFAALVFVFLGLLAASGIRVIERRTRAGAAAVALVAIVLFIGIARPPAFPLDHALPSAGLAPPPAYLTPAGGLPAIYAAVDSLPPGTVVVEFPFGDPWYDLRYMFFAATHRHRLLNGYSGVFPPSYLARQRVLARPTLDPARAAAAVAAASHAVVHPQAWTDDTGAVIAAWLVSLGAQAIAEADGAALYQMPVREALAEGTVKGTVQQNTATERR